MVQTDIKLVLWTGKKHCGKTTGVTNLVQIVQNKGFKVAGVLSPSLYSDGKLIGFDVLDLQNKNRVPLARRKTDSSNANSFTFMNVGLELGNTALSLSVTNSAELIIVDEFGPLELKGGGWRRSVDMLLSSSNALILLVVRQELTEEVQILYTSVPSEQLVASVPESIDKVVAILESRRDLEFNQ